MRTIIYRALILGMVGLALLAPLTAFRWLGKGHPWWRYLVVIAGGCYLIPVLGTLVGWKLWMKMSRKAGPGVGFIFWALVGIVLFSAVLLVVFMDSLERIRDTAMWLFGSPNGAALLLFFGLAYAGVPLIARRVQRRK